MRDYKWMMDSLYNMSYVFAHLYLYQSLFFLQIIFISTLNYTHLLAHQVPLTIRGRPLSQCIKGSGLYKPLIIWFTETKMRVINNSNNT